MPFHELIRVQCDRCREVLIVPQVDSPHGTLFHSHTQAIHAAEAQDWYVDARTVRCPEHWPEGPSIEVTVTDDPDTDIEVLVTPCRFCHLPAIPGLTTCSAHSKYSHG